jgi:hypothetical protein
MKKLLLHLGLAALALGVASGVQAQNQFEGEDIFVRGAGPPLPVDWGTDPSQQLLNDGTGGDQTAADTIWSRNIALAAGSTTMPVRWKMGAADWSPEYPQGDNSFIRPDLSGGVVKYVFDTTQYGDGFVPDPNGGSQKGIVYTIPKPVYTTDTVRVVGDFISEIGGGSWDQASAQGDMNDNGTGGDATAGDGIYTLSVTGLSPGVKNYKVMISPQIYSWDCQINTGGFLGFGAGGNLQFTVLASSDNIKIQADTNKGRTKVTNDNPAVNPGPPFFGTSSLWSTSIGAATQLYDNGTNGDVTSGDGIHSRVFTANAAATTATVRILQGVGPSYPGSGGYPLGNIVNGQKVLVQFDTNVLADGYSPNTRYVWTDPASRRNAPYVQPVGLLVDLGGAGDWDINATAFALNDTGATGDVAAGDGIFGGTFACGAINNRGWKAIGLQGSWDYQFGGAGDGSTYQGNNPTVNITVPAGSVTFQVDAASGRIGIGATLPTRPASFNASASSDVKDWMLF